MKAAQAATVRAPATTAAPLGARSPGNTPLRPYCWPPAPPGSRAGSRCGAGTAEGCPLPARHGRVAHVVQVEHVGQVLHDLVLGDVAGHQAGPGPLPTANKLRFSRLPKATPPTPGGTPTQPLLSPFLPSWGFLWGPPGGQVPSGRGRHPARPFSRCRPGRQLQKPSSLFTLKKAQTSES